MIPLLLHTLKTMVLSVILHAMSFRWQDGCRDPELKPTSAFLCCVASDKTLNLSELQLVHGEYGECTRVFSSMEIIRI